MRKALVLFGCFFAAILLAGAEWSPVPNLAEGNGSQGEYAGRQALRLETKSPSAKCYWWSEMTPVASGSKWILRFSACSDTVKRPDARAGVFFCNAEGKRLAGAGSVLLKPCGAATDWRDYELAFEVPSNAAGYRLTACLYQAQGIAAFANFTVTDAAAVEPPKKASPKVVPPAKISPKEEEKATPAAVVPAPPIWSYRFSTDGQDFQFDITGLELGAELAHYDGPDNLRYLSGQGRAVARNGAPYRADSSFGTNFWYLYNLETYAEACVFSDEKIDLADTGREIKYEIPFSTRRKDYYAPMAKGPYILRDHYYFAIRDKAGKFLCIASRQKVRNAQSSPEASFFGNGRDSAAARRREWLFTLADLSGDLAIEVRDLRAERLPKGKFAFRIVIRDAKGDEYPLNRVRNLQVTGDGKPLETAMLFDEWDIPTGWFVGTFGGTVPKTVAVRAEARATTPSGTKILPVAAEFDVADAAALPSEVQRSDTAQPYCIKPGEARGVFFPVSFCQALSPEEGTAAVRDAVARLRKANCTGVIAFVLGNRCEKAGKEISAETLRCGYSWDYMGVLRRETRAAGLELDGAFCLLTEGQEKPLGLLAEHPEWALRDATGKRLGWLDPAVPEVRKYRVRNILEGVKGWQLDGVELDYARLAAFPSDRGAEIYRERTGIDPRELEYGSSEYKAWFLWESEQLTKLVREISFALRRECPGVKLTAYVQGARRVGDALWTEGHQPFGDWLEEGLLDRIAPTGYVYDMLRYRSWVKQQIEYARSKNPSIPVDITIGTQSSHGKIDSLEELIYQIDEANRLGADGAHFFTWISFQKFAEALGKTRYAKPAK